MEVHKNFRKGYENMMELSKTKKFKKAYGQAVGRDKAKSKALSKAKKGGHWKMPGSISNK